MLGSIPPKLLPIAPAPKPEPNILKGLLCESAGIPPNPAKGLGLGACVLFRLLFVDVVGVVVELAGVVEVVAAIRSNVNKKKVGI